MVVTNRRLTVALALCLFAITVSMQAQTCSPPTIVQAGGSNPSCAGQPVTLDAGSGWQTYAWSNGATTRFVTDAPTAQTSYTVTVTDGSGCTVTSSPLVIATTTASEPSILLRETTLCAGTEGQATTDAVGSIEWAISGGHFVPVPPPSTIRTVRYVADGSGPIVVSVTSTEEGCSVTTQATVDVRNSTAPVIVPSATSVCASTTQTATVQSPSQWQYLMWEISGGVFVVQDPYWRESQYASGENVTFHSTGSGPVTLSVQGYDASCLSPVGTAQIGIRTIVAPVIVTEVSSVCPSRQTYATVEPPAEGTWQGLSWQITNGKFIINDQFGWRESEYAGGTTVTYYATGNAPVTLRAQGWDSFYCMSPEGTAQVAIRSIAAPVIVTEVSSVCPGRQTYATVEPPAEGTWQGMSWQITNGKFIINDQFGWRESEYAGGTTVTYYATGTQPVTLRAQGWDSFFCMSPEGTAQVAIRSIAAPVIVTELSSVCPGRQTYATVEPPAEGTWQVVSWQITNGKFIINDQFGWRESEYAGGTTVTYYATGTLPVTLRAQGWDSFFCMSPEGTAQVGIRTIAAPVIVTETSAVCPDRQSYATVEPPAEGTWQGVSWQITNGVFVNSYPYPHESEYASGVTVTYRATGTQPVTLRAQGWDSFYCMSPDGTAQVGIRTVAAPVVHVSHPTVCPGNTEVASVEPPAEGPWQQVLWSITNGYFEGGDTNLVTFDNDVFFYATGTGPITITATGIDTFGCSSPAATTQVALGVAPAAITASGSTALCGGASVMLTANAAATYLWSNGAATQSITVSEAGTYSVTIRDASGCFGTAQASVTTAPPPDANFALPAAICFPGGLALTKPANDPGTTYQWTWTGPIWVANDTLWLYDRSGAATLTLTVTSPSGCISTHTETRTVSFIDEVTIAGAPTACSRTGNAASVTGTDAYFWTIDGGTITSDPALSSITWDASPAATEVTLHVRVTRNGCDRTFNKQIGVDTTATASITTGGATTFCAGGSVGLSASYGASYLWSTGATTQTIFVNTSGTYQVTVTQANGCTATASETVTVLERVATITASGPTTFCQYNTVTLTASEGTAWLWTNGATTRSIAVGASGNYGVTVTLAPGCTATATPVPVTANPIPEYLTLGWSKHPNTLCDGDTEVITAYTATPGVTYLWSTGATTQSISVTTSGSYRVTVSTAQGCAATQEVVLNFASKPVPAITPSGGSTSFCGSTQLTASSTEPVTTWYWSRIDGGTPINIGSGPAVQVYFTGTYEVEAVYPGGCSRKSRIDVTRLPEAPSVGINVGLAPGGPGSGEIASQNGSSYQICGNPTLRLTSNAVAPDLTYSWSNGATTAATDVNTSGTYTLTITNAQGCSNTAQVFVTFNAIPPKPAITAPTTELCPVGGSITLTAPAADAYFWSNGATTRSIPVTQPGAYTVRVKSGVCLSPVSDPIVITRGQSTITASGSLDLCANGSVTLTANAGHSYAWSNGATTQSIVVTTAGTYSVAVTYNGCTYETSAPVTVTQRAASITANGPTTFCNGGSVTLTASPANSYVWSNGATTQSIVVTQSGSYTVTASFDGGCSITSALVAVESRTLTAAISADGPLSFCDGGSVRLTAPAGYTYSWSNGSSASFFDVSSSGTYRVTVTDALGCSATSADVVVTEFAALSTPVVTANGPLSFCDGGSVRLTAPAGYAYAWSNGASASFIDVSSSGTYRVTATDANGCSATSADVVVTEFAALATPVVTANRPLSFCDGGSVRLTAPAGFTYAWSNGATASFIDVDASGTYRVTVTDANGCSATSADVVVTEFAALANPNVSANGPLSFCDGGSVRLTAPAGFSYAWSNGATSSFIDVTSSGTYHVMVTDANGCSATSADVVVTEYAALATPNVSANGPLSFCDGGTVRLTAPAGFTYSWSNGATSQFIDVTASGTFRVTVTNANGCSATSSDVVVTEYAALATPSVTANGPLSFCDGGTVRLTAPAGFTYSWSTGATSSFIDVTSSGTYRVTVTDANVCSATSNDVVVTEYAALGTPVVTANGPLSFCDGGSVRLTAPAGFTYSWSTGATSSFIDVTSSGTYRVTFTDANGCSATSNDVVVTEYAALVAPVVTANGPLSFCDGGSVRLSAPAGFTYAWSNGATASFIDVTSSGAYRVTVTDANGCGATSADVVVTEFAALATPVAAANGPLSFCDGGSVRLTAPAGFTYFWSTGATASFIDVTSSGTYRVTVTDANGCSATSADVVVTEYAALATPVVTANGPLSFCDGGSVRLTAPAGFTYFWSTGGTASFIDVTSSGTYRVTVTDANGCSVTSDDVVVTEYAVLATPVVTANSPLSFCDGGSVRLTAPAGFTYSWSTGTTSSFIDVTSSGTYRVTVTDANGCGATSADVVVTEYAALAAPVVTANGPLSFCDGGSVRLTAPSGFTYSWSTGATSSFIDVTSSGTYRVTVTDANGCSVTSNDVVVTEYAVLATPVVTANGPLSFCDGGSVRLTAPAGFTYSWSTGAAASFIDVTSSGTYRVTVTDANGCGATSADVVVTEYAALATPVVTANGPLSFCDGGSVRLTAPAGFTYLWSNGTTSSFIDVASSGTFRVAVTNANGCSATSADVVVTEYAALATPNVTANGPLSFCDGGSVRLTAPAGFTYLWSNGATSQFIDVAASGTFRVTVTNANGCSATSADVVVTEYAALATPNVTANGPLSFCDGGTVRLTAPAGFTYLWSNGATSQFIDVTASGTFRVTVTNANGCSATSNDVVVTEYAALATPNVSANGPLSFCDGGTVRLTAPAGFTYLWSNGATSQFIDVMTSGTFRVTVTNANGCSATSNDVVVTEYAALATPNVSANGPLSFCDGGTVRLTAPAGFTYLWSNGATSQFIDVTASGTFRVTVTNANGCSAASSDVVVTEYAAIATPNVSANGPLSFCDGGTVRLTAPAGFTYLWSNGTTGQFIDVSASGTFRVTVTNANGCSKTSGDVVVTENPIPAQPVVTANGALTFCQGGTVRLTAPSGYASYAWSNGGTGAFIDVTTAGTYRVSVTTAAGCTSVLSSGTTVTVNAATAITAQPYSGPVVKNKTQLLDVGVSGTTPFTYQWQKGTSAAGPWTNVATTAAYTTPKLGSGTYWYRVIVTGPCGTVTSSVSTLTVN